MPTCEECGAHVTTDFARVFGDNENLVHGCLDCLNKVEVINGVPSEN